MNNRKIIAGFCLTLMVLLTACQSMEKNDNSWIVTDAKGNEKMTLASEIQLKNLNSIWANKREVIVKMMPEFDHELHIYDEGVATVWLYSTDGYVMLKEGNNKTIYRAKLTKLNKMMKQ